jgi:hypothetical protein
MPIFVNSPKDSFIFIVESFLEINKFPKILAFIFRIVLCQIYYSTTILCLD